MISYGRQTVEEDDVAAVVEALKSDNLTQGPLIEEFERAIASYTGARYAVVCSSGTSALHLSCLAAGIREGDSAITSPLTFLATPNSVIYAGGTPLFADIDPRTSNMDPTLVEEKLKSDTKVKALMPVHYAGLPADMESISDIARERGLTVIEDACHALGASWRDSGGVWRKVGSCSHSDMTVFSFHPVKSITTGEGGAVTTNDRRLYERLKLLRNHGVTKDQASFRALGAKNGKGEVDAPWLYEMHSLGFNYRMTDIQAALGLSQIKKTDRFVRRRAEIAELYNRFLSRYRFMKAPASADGLRSAFHLYPLRISFDEIGVKKDAWFRLMKEIGISLQVHYIPVHLQPYYRERFGFKPGDFPNAERFYEEEVSLPLFPLLTDEDVGMITAALISTFACSAIARAKLITAEPVLKKAGARARV